MYVCMDAREGGEKEERCAAPLLSSVRITAHRPPDPPSPPTSARLPPKRTIAKPTPTETDEFVKIAVLTPTTRPEESSSGPPLLPCGG